MQVENGNKALLLVLLYYISFTKLVIVTDLKKQSDLRE